MREHDSDVLDRRGRALLAPDFFHYSISGAHEVGETVVSDQLAVSVLDFGGVGAFDLAPDNVLFGGRGLSDYARHLRIGVDTVSVVFHCVSPERERGVRSVRELSVFADRGRLCRRRLRMSSVVGLLRVVFACPGGSGRTAMCSLWTCSLWTPRFSVFYGRVVVLGENLWACSAGG